MATLRLLILLLAHGSTAQGPPKLTYFKIAGRGELARLYAAVGNLTIQDSTFVVDYKKNTPIGYLPALSHPGSTLFPDCKFKFGCLQESLAVERYIANLAPGLAGLTPQQRAVDDMFAMIKEDVIHVEPGAMNASVAPALVTPIYDRYLAVIEELVPEAGFVNGKSFPTGADLSVIVMLKSGFPFAKALANAQYEGQKSFPKTYALADRTMAHPAVASYVAKSPTFYRLLSCTGPGCTWDSEDPDEAPARLKV